MVIKEKAKEKEECSKAREKDSRAKECSKEKERARFQRKGMKGKGKGQGYFSCGGSNHWSKECPKDKGGISALTEEEGQQEGNPEEWSQDAE